MKVISKVLIFIISVFAPYFLGELINEPFVDESIFYQWFGGLLLLSFVSCCIVVIFTAWLAVADLLDLY